jgi:hypothetical protein
MTNLNNQVRKFLSKVFNAGSPLFTRNDKLENKICVQASLIKNKFLQVLIRKDKLTVSE